MQFLGTHSCIPANSSCKTITSHNRTAVMCFHSCAAAALSPPVADPLRHALAGACWPLAVCSMQGQCWTANSAPDPPSRIALPTTLQLLIAFVDQPAANAAPLTFTGCSACDAGQLTRLTSVQKRDHEQGASLTSHRTSC